MANDKNRKKWAGFRRLGVVSSDNPYLLNNIRRRDGLALARQGDRKGLALTPVTRTVTRKETAAAPVARYRA